ncbi:MAG: helix-turn-helix domain-containing protein, partial [Bacteroidaceae bacterium]
SAPLLERYLTPMPSYTAGVPAIMEQDHYGNFEAERELLYKVLFDLRREVNELKSTVQKLAKKENGTTTDPIVQSNHALIHEPHALALAPQHKQTFIEQASNIQEKSHFINRDVQDAAEFIEDPLSLNDVERDMIEKALERHRGKRKQAAQDLHISERTLYRKIKAYGLDK